MHDHDDDGDATAFVPWRSIDPTEYHAHFLDSRPLPGETPEEAEGRFATDWESLTLEARKFMSHWLRRLTAEERGSEARARVAAEFQVAGKRFLGEALQ
jgi:hypothetical protein